jgi:PAS domain S-box-containing protein
MAKDSRIANKHGNKEPAVQQRLFPVSVRVVVLTGNFKQNTELVSILSHAGYRVEVITQLMAIQSICDEQDVPAALILDKEFKKGDPVLARTLSELRIKCGRKIPVIFLSTRKETAARLAAYRAGATCYLVKPVDSNRLLQIIATSALPSPQIPYRVMLVDDESALQAVHVSILRKAGMEVCVANDPLLVIEKLENFTADVLLLGMEMEECSGPELAVLLHDDPQYAEIPIVYLSAESELLLQIQSINSSNENYLSRHVAASHLVDVLSAHAQKYRKRREQSEILRSARYELERQQQALDSHAIVSVADMHGTIVYVNEKFCEVSGYSSEELIGKTHRIIKSGQHPAEFYAGMWDTIVKGDIWHGEVCNRRKDGSFYWVDTSIVPFMDVDGFPYHYISIRTDITHVKENEERLNRSQAFANIGTWDWDINTGGMVWSERMAPLLGYPDVKLAPLYDNILYAIHPDDLLYVKEAIKNCVVRGISYNIEHRCVWPDGSIHWLMQSGDVVRDTQGEPLHMLGLVQDITERKQAELALTESNLYLEEAQNLAKLGNWEADLDSGEMLWSDEIYRILGQNKSTFGSTFESFRSIVHPDDRPTLYACEIQAVKTASQDVVLRIIRPDGTVRYIHILSRGKHDTDGRIRHMKGTVQDVTELKEVELALLKAKEGAEAASRAKSEFLASISHELRTPLNAILGFSQLFSMDEQLPQKTRNNAVQIEQAGKHLLSLVNDLIDLARIESNKMELSMEAVKLKEVVDDSLNMVQSMAYDNGIKIIVTNCDVIDIVVWADYTRLRQALINLLTNAIKYNKSNGTVQLRCELVDGRSHIAITDTGGGIPLQKQARIFNAFDRLGAERGEIEGTGIGLVITKRLVEAMGGGIGFESMESKGSTFWLEFPLASNTARVNPAASLSGTDLEVISPAQHGYSNKPVTLYVEDNPMNLRLMQQIFAGNKEWELRSAENAEVGIEMARSNPPDLILMDINLPGMNGFQALSILRVTPETAHIPVIALTANAMKGDRETGMGAGFADYLTKPLNIPKLLEVLGKYLDNP